MMHCIFYMLEMKCRAKCFQVSSWPPHTGCVISLRPTPITSKTPWSRTPSATISFVSVATSPTAGPSAQSFWSSITQRRKTTYLWPWPKTTFIWPQWRPNRWPHRPRSCLGLEMVTCSRIDETLQCLVWSIVHFAKSLVESRVTQEDGHIGRDCNCS